MYNKNMESIIVSFTKARENLANILNDTFLTGQTYTITKRDIPIAEISQPKKANNKYQKDKQTEKVKAINTLAGMMKKEIDNSIEYAQYIRNELWRGK